jgi:hypothetical protein
MEVIPGCEPSIIIMADFCDHRIIDALVESQQKARNVEAFNAALEAADAKAEQENEQAQLNQHVDLAMRTGHFLRKNGDI